MPIGRPDWYIAGKSENVVSLDDMGELAARLGAPVNFDRTGKVIWFDVFDWYNSFWSESKFGLTTDPALDATTREYGGNSLKTVIGAGAANYCVVSHRHRIWQAARLSCEIGFATNATPSEIRINMPVIVGGVLSHCGLSIQNSMQDLYYQSAAAAYTLVHENGATLVIPEMFNAIKLDINIDTGYYIRARCNDITIDLSDYALPTAGGGGFNYGTFYLTVYGQNGFEVTTWLDRVIVTEDE